MSNIKLVKIGNTSKKGGSLDDILASSSKIRDIINKKKTLKSCRYLEKMDFTHNNQNQNEINPINSQTPLEQPNTSPLDNITIEKPPKEAIHVDPPPKEPKPNKKSKSKTDLRSYGENLEQTTISKRKKLSKSPRKPKSSSVPITNFFNKSNYKNKKTKKYNRHEIKYIINSFKKMYYEKDFIKLSKFINKLNRDQTIQILYACNVVEYKTDAPLPLLKNIVFNIVLGNIQIMR